MRPAFRVVRNEHGGGLLMALLVVVALAAIAAGIISAVSTDRRLASYNTLRGQALNVAEAGVAEAIERIRMGDVPDNRNAHMVSQVFLTSPGSVPSVGTDTTAMATDQPSGSWLSYSSDTQGPDVLTIQYMTNAARTGIYYYDSNKSPAIQGKTGNPVFQIHSVSHMGVSRRQVDASIALLNVTPNLKAAYTANNDVKFDAADDAIGFDYSVDTPSGTGSDGKRVAAYETGSGNVPGVWTTKKLTLANGSVSIGNPNSSQNQTGFYNGPWEVLNMQQAQFYNWLGSPSTKVQDNSPLPSGITYLSQPHDKPQKGKHNYKLKGGNADGMLYVNGNLEIDGDFTFRGLIYVEGDVQFKGNGWVIGGVVVHDKDSFKKSHHEQLTVLKSDGTVSQFINGHDSPYVTLGWREN